MHAQAGEGDARRGQQGSASGEPLCAPHGAGDCTGSGAGPSVVRVAVAQRDDAPRQVPQHPPDRGNVRPRGRERSDCAMQGS